MQHVSIIFYRENMTSFLNYVTSTLALFMHEAAHIYRCVINVFGGVFVLSRFLSV